MCSKHKNTEWKTLTMSMNAMALGEGEGGKTLGGRGEEGKLCKFRTRVGNCIIIAFFERLYQEPAEIFVISNQLAYECSLYNSGIKIPV